MLAVKQESEARLGVFGPRTTRSCVASACTRYFAPALRRPDGSSGPKWSRQQVADVVRLVLSVSTVLPSDFRYDEKTRLAERPFEFDHLDVVHITSDLEKAFCINLHKEMRQFETPFDIIDTICYRLGVPRC